MKSFDERNKLRDPRKKKVFNLDEKKHKAPCGCSGNSITRSIGEVVITVTRTSFNINADLPYCIFGALYLPGNSFANAIEEYLPDGVTVTTSITDRNVTFNYGPAAGLGDQIIVSVPDDSLINYLDIMASMNTNFMRSEFLLFDCNAHINAPVLADSQIRKLKSLGLFLTKVGGARDRDVQVIIPGSRTEINNSTTNLAQIYLRNEEVKAESVWVHKFAYTSLSVPATRLQFNWTLFVSERIDLNSEAVNIDMK